VQADYSVELGPDDDMLEIPWSSPDGTLHYCDLRRNPELIAEVTEAIANPPLKVFLAAINSRSIFSSAKCDVWLSEQLNPEEDIYVGSCKFGSYVDLVFAEQHGVSSDPRFSFKTHEDLLKHVVHRLSATPDIPASAEFSLRRCHFHLGPTTQEGFYVTLYVFGYGADEIEARRHWAQALSHVQTAVSQLSPRVDW
jgi:hypothetical protein